MATCSTCGSTIIFGGVRDGDLRFCNEKCHGKGGVLLVANQVPPEIVQRQAFEIHRGLCPKCGGQGPVDVHVGYRVWSALFVTSWQSMQRLCCRSCGVKGQTTDLVFSLVLGWWGIPFGFIMTPVQVVRNVIGMMSGPEPETPSARLEKTVRIAIATQAIINNAQAKDSAAGGANAPS